MVANSASAMNVGQSQEMSEIYKKQNKQRLLKLERFF